MNANFGQFRFEQILRGVLTAALVALCSVCGMVFAIERDFNGDLRADILWRHHGAGGTGQNYFFPLNGITVLAGEGYLPTVSDMSWEVVGVGDFNGDLRADVLWRNAATGQNYIYLMQGLTVVNESYIPTVADLNWKVVGTGDFNGDGRADVLWRNAATGQNYIYLMQGLTVANEGYIPTVADLSWQVVGTGDFNGDGRADILWRNRSTGQNYIYLMQGLTVANQGFIPTVASASWKVVGTGDFNGDSRADILWRNAATGENYIYLMQGLTVANEGYIPTVADRNWQVVSVGNFDGNLAPATDDVLWRNFSTGENYLFPMNGLAVLPSEGFLPTVADRDWKVQPASACPAVSSSGLTLSAVPSRTSGVAPLYVFFDATATTSTATTRPFHEVEYQWNFGDAASGTWGATPGMPNLRRNLATGPVAAHVFETPGTYTVCATAFDGTNTSSKSIEITVTNPDSVFSNSTLCVGATTGPAPVAAQGGCPANAAVLHSSDFDAAINNNIATRKRILFRRGDTFNANAASQLDVAGPGLIGAYGTGAKPLIESTASGVGIVEFSRSGLTINDWRVMDLNIDGNSTPDSFGFQFLGDAAHHLLLRVDIHHVKVGARMSPFVADALGNDTLWDAVGLVDSTITTLVGGSGGNGLYVGAQRFALMGNVFSDSTGAEHILRTPNIYKSVISHNSMSTPATAKHVVKLQAAVFGVSPTTFSEQIVMSDNKFTTGTGAAWTVTLGPQDAQENEKVRNVIVERNWFAPHSGQQVALMVWAQDVTVRNNVFNLTGTSDKRGMIIERRGIEPPPANVHVYNNTFYSSSSGNFVPIAFDTGAGMIAKNNLGYAPSVPGASMVSGSATQANNTTNPGVSPAFVGAPPAAPADFALGAASTSVNAGASVPVFSDFFRRGRPLNGPIDRGAFERP